MRGLSRVARSWSRLDVTGTAKGARVVRFAELLEASEAQKVWITARADGWGAPVLVAFDRGCADAMVHAFLGGGALEDVGEQGAPREAAAPLASGLLRRVALAALDAYGAFFPAAARPVHRILSLAPRADAMIPDDEPMLVQTVTLAIGPGRGALTLALPRAAFRDACRKAKPARAAGPLNELVAAHLAAAEVEVAAVAGEATILVRELMALEVGDVLALDVDAAEPWTLAVEGLPKAKGRPGVSRGRRALKIV